MYTPFETLFLSNERRQKYNFCVLFLKPVRLQNSQLLPQHTSNNDVEQSDIPSEVIVDLGFKTLLTSQVISIAFYSEREKSDKFCSEAVIPA